MSIKEFLFLFLIVLNNNKQIFVRASDDENRLVHYLFSEQGYNPLVRPVRHSNETVAVSFGLLLVQLIHVYEKEQIMKTNTWLHMKWYDSQLRWNPDRYGGVQQINVPFPNVWTPDVVLFNNADGNYEVSFKSKVILMHTGEVQWVPPAIYKSSCRIDVKYFPFDTQECEMRFASWTYNAKEVTFMPYIEDRDKKPELTKLLPQHAVSVTSDELYKDDYLESGTWDVISIPSRFVHYRTNASSPWPDYIEIVFLIKMSRKTLYYTVNLIVPTGLMSILICIVFCLPTAAGEKMTLCMSILLALNLFQLLVTKILPPTSAVVPLIAKYLLFTFSLNVLVIVNTVVITNFYYRTPMTHSMPRWLRRLFLNILPPILLMKTPKVRELNSDDDVPEGSCVPTTSNNFEQSLIFENPFHREWNHSIYSRKSSRHEKGRAERSPSAASFISYVNNKRRTSTILMKPLSQPKRNEQKENLAKSGERFLVLSDENPHSTLENERLTKSENQRKQLEAMKHELNEALDNIRYIAAHCAHESLIESIRDEWKFIATVIDRLQFLIFLIVTFFGSLALLYQVPHLFPWSPTDPQKLIRFSNPNMTVHELIRNVRT